MRDLLVVGGGPVGLATALYADRAGLSVAVLERRTPPVDKACGEGLMPGAVRALRDLGVEPDGHGFDGIRYAAGARRAEAHFSDGPGLGVRRTTLHAALAAEVAARGLEVLQLTVDSVEQDADRVTAAGLHARYLIGADGLHSSVRRLTGLDHRGGSHVPTRFGLRRHFEVEPWTDLVEVHWAPDLEAYVTPVGSRLVGVALLTGRRVSFDEQLAALPELSERLGSESGEVLGAGPLHQRSSARTADRVLLAGDAAGYVDALTGEGIAVGLASAREAVAAVWRDDPASYERAWLRVSRRYRWITGSLLWARQHRPTAGLIVPGAQYVPGLFAAAVNQLAH